ncbi:hypothetical protein DFJ74DRAFT_759739 [Hyaloraphidium curvatum]|nr:hypothetical protein DFJ74DRAFT_759739 [Hyaloraphidium curvatum]
MVAKLAVALLGALVLSATGAVQGHMMMRTPVPRGSKYGSPQFWTEDKIDYDLVAPLSNPNKPYPCAGKPAGPRTATITSGRRFTVTLEGSATHHGGHCQFAISYDGGKTFVVLHTVRTKCLLDTLSYTFSVPKNLPACNNCIFSWNWINAQGNREFYANCADVNVVGPRRSSFTGPRLLVANIQGPVIPEFNQDWNPNGYSGLDLLNKRPKVTVRGPGTPGKRSDTDEIAATE